MKDTKDLLDEINTSLGKLQKESPEFMKAFGSFMHAAEKEGTLSVKTKELISIALSIATHCEWCIAFHVKNALDAGATREEIIEVCQVATLMGGGPSLMYAQLVLKALEDLS